jgi:hypothetical protein
MKLKDKYREVLENRDWSITGESAEDVELEWYSPAGEDFTFCVEAENFPDAVAEYATDFDVDEHIEMWVIARQHGVNGVPSVRELVCDAEKISAELQELAAALAMVH